MIDPEHRVFGYENLLVCDGSAVPANPGVNPSLTITAMAERAMQHIPAREEWWRDEQRRTKGGRIGRRGGSGPGRHMIGRGCTRYAQNSALVANRPGLCRVARHNSDLVRDFLL